MLPEIQSEDGRRFLSKIRVADRLGVHPSTIERWVREKLFPPPIKPTPKSACRWPEYVIEAWETAELAKASGSAMPQAAEASP